MVTNPLSALKEAEHPTLAEQARPKSSLERKGWRVRTLNEVTPIGSDEGFNEVFETISTMFDYRILVQLGLLRESELKKGEYYITVWRQGMVQEQVGNAMVEYMAWIPKEVPKKDMEQKEKEVSTVVKNTSKIITLAKVLSNPQTVIRELRKLVGLVQDRVEVGEDEESEITQVGIVGFCALEGEEGVTLVNRLIESQRAAYLLGDEKGRMSGLVRESGLAVDVIPHSVFGRIDSWMVSEQEWGNRAAAATAEEGFIEARTAGAFAVRGRHGEWYVVQCGIPSLGDESEEVMREVSIMNASSVYVHRGLKERLESGMFLRETYMELNNMFLGVLGHDLKNIISKMLEPFSYIKGAILQMPAVGEETAPSAFAWLRQIKDAFVKFVPYYDQIIEICEALMVASAETNLVPRKVDLNKSVLEGLQDRLVNSIKVLDLDNMIINLEVETKNVGPETAVLANERYIKRLLVNAVWNACLVNKGKKDEINIKVQAAEEDDVVTIVIGNDGVEADSTDLDFLNGKVEGQKVASRTGGSAIGMSLFRKYFGIVGELFGVKDPLVFRNREGGGFEVRARVKKVRTDV